MDWNAVIIIALEILAVFFLVFLNGFFVATEFAIVKVRQTQLLPLVARGLRRARMAMHLTRHLDAYLSACQLGITLASLALGWIGEPVFEALLEPVFNLLNVESEALRNSVAIGVGFGTITFLHIVVGEMAPKSLAIRLALPTSLWIAHPMHWFYVAMYPFIWALNESSLLLLRWVGLGPATEDERTYSEDELRLLLTTAGRSNVESALDRNIILNALELRRRIVREVMRPPMEIVAFDTVAPIAECLDLAEKSRYSRFPLCEGGNLDKTLGVVHIKDLYAMRHKAQTGADLLPAARKLIYVPETARLEKLLDLLLQRRLHFAIVVDEYGGTTGMVTLENVLEELVGQIQDEFDQEKPLLTRTGEASWDIDGGLPLHALADLIGQPIEEESVATASGWVTHKLSGFPKVGDTLKVANCELRVEELDGPRVARLKLTRQPAADA